MIRRLALSGGALIVLSCAPREVASSDSSIGTGSGGSSGTWNGDASVPSSAGGTASAGSGGSTALGGSSGATMDAGAAVGGSGGAGEPAADAGPAASPKLRSTPPGGIVRFDPGAVYAVGYVSDVNMYDGPYGIAPVLDTTDTVTAIPLFGDEFIRPTDGHLVYSYLGADAQGMGHTTPLYEMRRDEGDLSNPTYGETALADVWGGCLRAPRGTSGNANNPGRYYVGYDGAVYFSCYLDQGVNQTSLERWFTADGTTVPLGTYYPLSFGADGHVLAVTDHGTYVVLDSAANVLGAHSANELFGGDGGSTFAITERVTPEGFLVVGGPPNYQPTPNLEWMELSFDGGIIGRGAFEPLPQGVNVDSPNTWNTKYPALDGNGALYEFGVLGADEGVIVRRPMTGHGASDIVFRQGDWSADSPHQVMPDHLVTGP